MSILNIAQSGHFASDRTILQYRNVIWGIGNAVKQF
ncbi:MAG: glycogen/starch/alpha-glucan phosphorylase [Bacillus cereus]|nr:glycogen/starch/alpha-glucan phosphorylase [Bacillus cereus]